jgi:hypothetical protein
MKKWFQPANQQAGGIDKHSEPTEPLPPLPFASAPTDNAIVPDEQTSPLVLTHSSAPTVSDQQGVAGSSNLQPPFSPPSYSPPAQNDPYQPYAPQLPHFPPSPIEQEGQKLIIKTARSQWQGRGIPLLVGMCFVVVQLLLVLRLVLQIVNLTVTRPWLDALQGITSLFSSPFYWLLQQVPLPLPLNAGTYLVLSLLVAILAYGFLSRILVRLLKVILNWRNSHA